VCWIGVIAWGFGGLAEYSVRPGSVGTVPPRWPSPPGIELARECPTFLMFVHPQCPCSRASLEQLQQIMAVAGSRVAAGVGFFQAADAAADWGKTESWRMTMAMPVRVVQDSDGNLARRFGAETSGQVVMYSPSGALLFSGGITPVRGEVGENAGQTAV